MAEIFYPTNPADDCLAQWDCDKCGERLAVFTWSAGQDVECPTCGLLYNAAGQVAGASARAMPPSMAAVRSSSAFLIPGSASLDSAAKTMM